ncbi:MULTISPECIES: exodeoxyribonuclease V subunit gamma [unclassified Mannheimia]|uniref:exodeoxyribonuclease V subunit gamma n=1 Tax=unclassified Mannheimia TaxID=2645054 RepID=UPI00359CCD5A
MFTLYQSNQISSLAEMLVKVQQVNPLEDPFAPETILIQSQGMAQWLQMQIAELNGIMGNCHFLYPTTFLWQQYRVLFPELPKENIFDRSSMTWRLMRLLPNCLTQAEFEPLQRYLANQPSEEQYQLKLYQLSTKIAELFDQYLVYRPHWLVHWEEGNLQAVENELKIAIKAKNVDPNLIAADIKWQSHLWQQIVQDLQAGADDRVFTTSHRAYLQQNYFEKLDNLTEAEKAKLPKRIFIFGISAFSPLQLAVFKKLSEHCDIHIFFFNPSEKYWGDSVEDKVWQELALTRKISPEDLENLLAEQSNKLLNLWGKQGRDFLAQLMEFEPHTIDVFAEPEENNNLNKLKKQIFNSANNATIEDLTDDHSIQIHACHSPMREVEVLHNQLLNLFEKDKTLLPKDIIVMSPDINKYAPYIDAVFSRNKGSRDPRYIPFSLSDQAFTKIDPIIHSFLQLLAMKESQFNAEDLFDLLEVGAIQTRFAFSAEDIHTLRIWAKNAGVRSGIEIQQPHWQNYNSWENGLNRLLLGSSLKEAHGIWENTLAFGDSYGLNAELVGRLASFISTLLEWVKLIQSPQSLEQWHLAVKTLIADLYQENAENAASILLLNTVNDEILALISTTHFAENLHIDIVELMFNQQLNQHSQQLNFLVGRVNFATLLPMRAIPFKVVCLLGMNEADFPRQQQINSFDLMQYAPQKGDRAKRDDDRYLFLEALLSAQNVFYISYIGQSQKDGKEMLPSILVSQLLDTINDYLEPEFKEQLGIEAEKILVRKQPLTVFSKKNFTHPRDYAYNAEWIIIPTSSTQDFLSEPLNTETVEEIEIGNLIRFVQNPIKFFFVSVLGISFNTYDDTIDESEIFAISGLDNYAILNELLTVSPEQQEQFFEKEQLKGNLPASNFATTTKQDLISKISDMRATLAEYLTKDSTILTLNQNLAIDEITINLNGNLENVFNEEIVLWRVGGLRDKDKIAVWIYHLFLCAYFPQKNVKFYYREAEQTGLLSFEKMLPEEALSQLTIYVKDYLAGLSQAQLVVYQGIDDYLKKGSENSEQALSNLAEDREGSYINRILSQTSTLNSEEIYQHTVNWFGVMNEKITANS